LPGITIDTESVQKGIDLRNGDPRAADEPNLMIIMGAVSDVDEASRKSIKVTLSDTSNHTITQTVDASFSGNGQWTLDIDAATLNDGPVTIKVEVTNKFGDVATTTSTVQLARDKWGTPPANCPDGQELQNGACVAKSTVSFTISPDAPKAGNAVTFTPTASGINNIASVKWTFGDGAEESAANLNPATHTYSTAGTYTAKLTVTDNTNTFETTQTVIVGAAASGFIAKQISTGGLTTCAIATNGMAYCWGLNMYGQLGNNSTVDSPVPVPVGGALAGKSIKQIVASGTMYACAIAADNTAYCWGDGGAGSLGNNSYAGSSVPVPVGGALAGKSVKQISTMGQHTCAIDTVGQAYCWGPGYDGQLGAGERGPTGSSNVPVAVGGALAGKPIKQISAGAAHTCAIAADDTAYCWGVNLFGALGNNSTADSSVPVPVGGALAGKPIKQISAGFRYTCAIAADDTAYCWGFGGSGRLGNNSTADSSVPVPVGGVLAGKPIKQISAGGYSTCAIAADDMAYCWGAAAGALGNNSTADSSVPVPVGGALAGKPIKQISVSGGFTACAIAADDTAYCWGDNSAGQLGNGFNTTSKVPVAVVRP